MAIPLLILFVIFQTYIVFKFTNKDSFFYVFWRGVTAWWCVTTCFALLLSSGDPYFLDSENVIYILFVSGLGLIHFTVSIIFFYMIKPIIKEDGFFGSLKIFTYISILFNLGLAINIYFGVKFDVANQVFPFTLVIESMVKITPFMGIYYWRNYIFRDKAFVLLNVLMFYMVTIPNGNRYQLLATLFFTIFFLIRISNFTKISIVVLIVLAYLPLEPIHSVFKSVAGKKEGSERIELMIKAVNNASSRSIPDVVESFRKRILHSYYLIPPVYKHLERVDSVGFVPVYTAAQSIIPASYFTNNSKPWPGSVDGSRFSSFSYLVNGIAFNQGYNMSEFPRVLHYLWEWNYIYMALMSILSAVYLASLFYLSKLFRDKLYIIPMISISPFTYNRFFPTIVEMLQAIPYVILPIVFLFVLNSLFNYLKKCNPSKN